MTIENKLLVIDELIRQLSASQEEIKDTLRQSREIPIRDDSTKEHLEALSNKVRDIESQIEDQSAAINEATKFAQKLLQNISSLTHKVTASTSASTQLLNGISETETDDHRRTPLKHANASVALSEGESQITQTQTNANAFVKQNEITVASSRSSDKKNAELPNELRTTPSIKESQPGRKEHKNVCRNDFGYKHSQSDIKFDNRVSFHGNQECFQGEMLASGGDIPRDLQEEPNISFTDPIYDRQFAEALSRHEKEEQSKTFFNPEVDQPKTLTEWLTHAENLRITGIVKSGMIQRGRRGHDYVLVLDCSARMKGAKFNTMVNTVKTYVNGIKEVSQVFGLQDNVGLAVFGEVSTVVIEPTCDYNILLSQIDHIKPGGEAPLVGGLLMGLAGVLGTARTTSLQAFEMRGFIIMFTDSASESTSPTGIDPSYNFYDPRRTSTRMTETESVTLQIADNGIKIYYVPVDEIETNQLMEMAVVHSNGKTVKPNEIHRLIRMTQTLCLATTIATDLRFQRIGLTEDLVNQKIVQMTSADDPFNDCADMVMELIDPRRIFASRGLCIELTCNTLKLGDRVKRGPHWMFGEQDSGVPGTVIGEQQKDQLWVQWDSGSKSVYLYDETRQLFSLKKIFNYRRVHESDVLVGCRVERGSAWAFGDEDGGVGSKGTVLNANMYGCTVIRWDCGRVFLYKVGKGRSSEIKLSDESKVTTSHEMPEPKNSSHQNEDDINIDKYIIPVNQKTEVQAVWEYNEDGEWKRFSEDILLRLEKYYARNKTGKPLLKIEGKL